MPLPPNADGLEFETVTVDVFCPKHTRPTENWSLLRAFYYSFPGLTYLKDLLPNADKSVVYRNTLLPIHTLVASHMTRGRNPVRELLVQFTEKDYENSAWIPEMFVPQKYLDEFWARVEPDDPPS
jgi:hypothetical protein